MIKELIRVFCCPTVQIVSLQECLVRAFWCHKFVWPVERRYNVEKIEIGCFSWMLERLLQKVCFLYNAWIKENKTKHLHRIWMIIHQSFLQEVPHKLRNIPKAFTCKHAIQFPPFKCDTEELKLCTIRQCKLSLKSIFLNSCYWAANMLAKWGRQGFLDELFW